MNGLKCCKSYQENVFLCLATRKLAKIKMNGSFVINHVRSGMHSRISQITEEVSYFRLAYLEYFMIPNLVRLNLAILKISLLSQEHTRGGVLY